MDDSVVSCPPCRSPEKCVGGECAMEAEKRAALSFSPSSLLMFALAVNGRTSQRLDEEERKRREVTPGGTT